MPTPRQHGGAPLQHFPLNLPAFKGLNKQARGSVLGPEWATRLENTVLDTSNRVASRKGWLNQTTTAAADNFKQLVEYNNSGTKEIIAVTTNNTIFKSTNNGVSWSAITGTATVTDQNMQLVQFNDKLLGFQNGGTVIIYTGTTFSNLGATGEPTGGIALAAFGRLWAVDSTGRAVKYCALLDETDWTGSDTGTLDLTSVWQGQDTITAVAEFNGALVIFSKRNIVVYTDGAGSELGIDPVQAYVADTITGIGCIARDSIANIKGDLWFLDDTGIHSLGRLVNERSNPLNNISRNVQDELASFVNISTASDIRAVYSPRDRFYLLSLPAGGASAENGVVFCFDTRGALEDGSFRCTGIWNQMVPRAMVVRDNFDLLMALALKTGKVGKYDQYLDDLSEYVMEYESGWTDLGQPELKILKRISGLLFIAASTTVTYKWAFDFDDTFKTATTIYPGSGTSSEWGTAEWNVGEWGGGVNIREKRVGGRGTGEYIKVGFTIEISSDEISAQQISLYAKQGRLV